ncbi:DUF4340 domain-containing protein [bacterium]|nr:DUF4340 domain-containing protein [bacterium]
MLKNMKSNPWFPYLAVFGILILLLVYTQFREQKYQAIIKPIFKFKPEEVTGFSISKDNVSVSIVKKDTAWFFAEPDTGQPAKYKIDQFLKEVLRGEREGAVTDDTSRYAKLGVQETFATRVIIRNEHEDLATIFVGRSQSDYNQEYIRYSDDPNVYPSRQKMVNKLGAVASWWR